MKDFINRVFNIYPDELYIVMVLGFLLLSNDMARQTSGIVGISDFLDEGGINQILLVKAIDAVLIIFTSIFTSLIVDRYDRIKLLRWTVFTFAAVFFFLLLISSVIPGWLSAAILFIMSQQQWLIIPLIFWVLANDIFSTAQTKRLFPVIGSWSFIGKILGIGVAFLPGFLLRLGIGSSPVLTLNMVLIFNIGVYLIAFGIITVSFRHIHLRKIVHKEDILNQDLTQGGRFLRKVSSFRFLAIAIIFLMVVDLTTEFQFFVVSKTTIPNAVQYQRFYSFYLLVAAILSFLMQSFFTGRIINKVELRKSFFIVPFVALGSVLMMIIWPGLVATTGAVLMLKVIRNTIDGTTRKSFESLIPAEFRGRVSLFMNNYLPAAGTILGCITTGVVVYIGVRLSSSSYFYVYLGIAAIAAIIEIWAIFKMYKIYDVSLLNWRLKRRGRKGMANINF